MTTNGAVQIFNNDNGSNAGKSYHIASICLFTWFFKLLEPERNIPMNVIIQTTKFSMQERSTPCGELVVCIGPGY